MSIFTSLHKTKNIMNTISYCVSSVTFDIQTCVFGGHHRLYLRNCCLGCLCYKITSFIRRTAPSSIVRIPSFHKSTYFPQLTTSNFHSLSALHRDQFFVFCNFCTVVFLVNSCQWSYEMVIPWIYMQPHLICIVSCYDN